MKKILILIGTTWAVFFVFLWLEVSEADLGFASLSLKEACAEDVKAKRSSSILASPGEQGAAVTRVHVGDVMSVLERRGRWIKVRVNGRTGWIVRTSVSGGAAQPSERKTRKRAFVKGRSKKRKKRRSRAPSDRVGADAIKGELDNEGDDGFDDEVDDGSDDDGFDDDGFDDDGSDDDGFDDEGTDDQSTNESSFDDEGEVLIAIVNSRIRDRPSKKSKSVARAKQGDILYLVERKGAWAKVENENGDEGWVRLSLLQEAKKQESNYRFHLMAAIGYSAFSQSFSTEKNCLLCNYDLATGAMTTVIGGDFIFQKSPNILIAADLSYQYSRANPGIRYVDEANNAADISFQVHQIEAGGRVGYRLEKHWGTTAYARIGYHYNRFGIDEAENFDINLPRLASEILAGATVELLVDVPNLSDSISIRVGASYLLGGKRVQTVGLEDGAASKASGLWGIARLDYRWKSSLRIIAQYQHSRLTTTWTGKAEQSLREHTAVNGVEGANRTDTVHSMYLGLSKAL